MQREILGNQTRLFQIHREAVTEDGQIEISFSSETEEVERWYGVEILSHEPGAMDMTRAASGLPLLDSHDCTRLIGRVENIRVDADRRGRGVLRFSSSPEAQQIRQDMQDGIRPDISVGYIILEYKEAKGRAGAPDVVTITKWMPLEISSVAVPADVSVGVGRALEALQPTPATLAASTEVPMEPSTVAAPVAASPNIQELRSNATREAAEIVNLAGQHGLLERASDWLSTGRTLDQVRAEILEAKRTAPLPAPIKGGADVDSQAPEMRDYSLLRALRSMANGENCPELEISKTIAKQMGRDTNGFFMPTNLAMRAGLDSLNATKGAELKFTEPGSFIDLLRNRAMVLRLGATLMPGLQGNVAFPRQTGAGTAAWLASENPGSDAAESNVLFDQVTLAAKTLLSTTSYSRQLLVQSSYPVEQKVREDLAAIMGIAIDLAAINGSGSSGVPKGILNVSGIGSVAMGTNGAVLGSVSPLVDLETAVAVANADYGSLGYLTTPGQRGYMKKTPAFSTAGASPIWTGAGTSDVFGEVNGYKAAASAQVPNNLTKGTASGICHAVIFGNWSELLIGEWGAMEILVDPYRLKKQGMIEITSIQFADVQVKHAASFAAIKDAL